MAPRRASRRGAVEHTKLDLAAVWFRRRRRSHPRRRPGRHHPGSRRYPSSSRRRLCAALGRGLGVGGDGRHNRGPRRHGAAGGRFCLLWLCGSVCPWHPTSRNVFRRRTIVRDARSLR